MAIPETRIAASGAPSRRRSAVLVILVLVACAVAWTVGRNLIPIARAGYHASDRPGNRIVDSDLDPLTYFASTRALSGAREIIPPGETYTIVLGTTKPPFSALPGPALMLSPPTMRLAFKLWLLPRRYVPLSRAQWVVAYDIPAGDLGVKVEDAVNLGPDATLVKVEGR
jgi:hypothetical protein